MDEKDYFKFFGGWWLRSPAVRSLPPEVRDFCVTLMCFMSQGNPVGTLTTEAGKAMTPRHVVQLTGLAEEDARRMVTELINSGALAREPFSRIIYDPRQVKERELSEMKRKAGLQGGNPALKQPKLAGTTEELVGAVDKQSGNQNGVPYGRHHLPLGWKLTEEETASLKTLARALWHQLPPAEAEQKLGPIIAEFRTYWWEMARLDAENNTKKAMKVSWYLTLVSRVRDVHDRESRGLAAVRLRADATAPASSPEERPAERRPVTCVTCAAARADEGLPPCPFHKQTEEENKHVH